MTRDREIMARAMNFIDDDLLEAAHAPRKTWRRIMPTLAAACLILVVLVSYPFLRDLLGSESKGDMAQSPDNDDENAADGGLSHPAPEASPPALGDPITLGGTTVTMTAFTDKTATYTIVKTDDVPLYLAFFQYAGGMLGTTEPDYRDNGTIVRDNVIRIYVNGSDERCDTLPSAPGTYEVLVDYSVIKSWNYVMSEIAYFYAYIGEEGAPVTAHIFIRSGWGWDEPNTETEASSETEGITANRSTNPMNELNQVPPTGETT